jgi:SAM-dependent methyltransferase
VSIQPRYDGHADWYDDTFNPLVDGDELDLVRGLLGEHPGEVCLDVACGSGRHAAALTVWGYRPAGVDLSHDQLRIAQRRCAAVVQADAGVLPFGDESVAHAVGWYFHTDVEDFAGVVAEVARCLRPDGRFIYVGLHPCFIGSFVDRSREQDESRLVFEPGYAEVGWSSRGSGGGIGLWSRVGGHHKTLTAFLDAFLSPRLAILRVVELSGGGTVLPRTIAVSAMKPTIDGSGRPTKRR